jgi:hypothetical protein
MAAAETVYARSEAKHLLGLGQGVGAGFLLLEAQAAGLSANEAAPSSPFPQAKMHRVQARGGEYAYHPAVLQEALANLGYYKGKINGKLTPETRRALARYQRDKGYPATGRLTEEQAEYLLDTDGGIPEDTAHTPPAPVAPNLPDESELENALNPISDHE